MCSNNNNNSQSIFNCVFLEFTLSVVLECYVLMHYTMRVTGSNNGGNCTIVCCFTSSVLVAGMLCGIGGCTGESVVARDCRYSHVRCFPLY